MDLKQLRFFCGVVDAGSFTKAADQLNIAQPALGLQIRHLEEELGVTLLIRHSRGVKPTEPGQRLLREARKLLQEARRIRTELTEFGGQPRGRIGVGLTPTVTLGLAAILVQACRDRHPGIVLHLVEGLSEWLMEWVEGDQLDLVLTYNRTATKAIAVEPLVEERLFLIGPPDAGPDGPVTFAEVAALPLVLPSDPMGLRAIAEETAESQGLELRLVCEADSVPAMKDLVRHGLGRTILPLGAVKPELETGLLVARPIVEPQLTRRLYLATPAGRPPTKATDAVLAEIRGAVARLTQDGSIGWRALAPEA